MLVNGRHYRTVWMENGLVKLIDQTKLPFSFEIHSCANFRDTAAAIKNMVVRGAPAIGATAAYALVQACISFKGANLKSLLLFLGEAEKIITSTRPTAYDLFFAVDFVKKEIGRAKSAEQAKKIAVAAGNNYADESVKRCMAIGSHGEKLIKDDFRLLTHCNAGWLACVDWGTATAPVYKAARNKKYISVFVDETRPRSQGSRLTAWELKHEGVDHSIIADNAAGFFMSKGDIDMVIVGADRIAMNGDVANKIGTLEKAIVAKEFGIPFYVAAPFSTIDFNCKSGKDIPIEERSEDEVKKQTGLTDGGELKTIFVSNPESRAINPSFDVTPAKFIKGIITEKGIIKANKNAIRKLMK
ncbi:MAG: S-methyl-5-thioribose-1-phosphate isomerase [Candidatus Aenigmarchaeota archaeon]|nr:S-methyl-5-thioribose-1-phosphate isomerase [Candidatus Aenigmarchaeota archaeon]